MAILTILNIPIAALYAIKLTPIKQINKYNITKTYLMLHTNMYNRTNKHIQV